MLKVSGKRFWPETEIVYQGCGNSCKNIHIRKKIRKKIHKKIQGDTINDPVSSRRSASNRPMSIPFIGRFKALRFLTLYDVTGSDMELMKT